MSTGSPVNPPLLQPHDTQTIHDQADQLLDRKTLRNNIIAASSGALVTSLIVTPMDVVKNRLQAQQSNYQSLSKSIISELDALQTPHICERTTITTQTTPESTTVVKKTTINTQSIVPGSEARQPRIRHSRHSILREYFRSQQLNLKTRAYTHYEQVIKRSSFYKMNTGIMDIWCPKCNLNPSLSPAIRFNGVADAVYKITKYEGIRTLWRGLSPSLMMAVPNTAIYFTGYEYLKTKLEHKQQLYRGQHAHAHAQQQQERYSNRFQPKSTGSLTWKDRVLLSDSLPPLVSGMIARTISTSFISPLELVRTRAQTTSFQSNQPIGSLDIFKQQFRLGGARSLFTGLSSTLMRDVPFSGIYWVSIEKFRVFFYNAIKYREYTFSRQHMDYDREHHRGLTSRQHWLVSFLAGGISGMFAALATHPFDVIKTRKQMSYYQFPGSGFGDPQNLSMIQTFKKILHEEGRRGLFIGLTPRVTKVIPSCAIMLSSFDVVRKVLKEQPA